MNLPIHFLKDQIFKVNPSNFENRCLEVFHHQYRHNKVYQSFVDLLHINPDEIRDVLHIPFMPIEFFKTFEVIDDCLPTQLVFESSGTTSSNASKHYISDPSIYHQSLLKGFELFYGLPNNYTILALLPNYLERGNSSLVYMVNELMKHSSHSENGFYLYDFEGLKNRLEHSESSGQKTILFGVTYALIDFINTLDKKLHNTIIIETGGMKGNRKEITKLELHELLATKIEAKNIHSEYGMTELLSQSYAQNGVHYQSPPWKKLLIRDIADPFQLAYSGTGCLNIIDLANIHSCAFIATDDIGTIKPSGQFEILGRMDHSDKRGCSLMYQ